MEPTAFRVAPPSAEVSIRAKVPDAPKKMVEKPVALMTVSCMRSLMSRLANSPMMPPKMIASALTMVPKPFMDAPSLLWYGGSIAYHCKVMGDGNARLTCGCYNESI